VGSVIISSPWIEIAVLDHTSLLLVLCFFLRLTHLHSLGVDGVDVVIGTSSFLREFSHGKDMNYITKTAIEVINFVKSKSIEVRFSSEDSFRSDLVDLLSIYQTVDKIGVNRVGIADTVGCANPRQVYDLVRTLRGVVGCDIEIHLHNDTGMGRFLRQVVVVLLTNFYLSSSYRKCVHSFGGWRNPYRHLQVYPHLWSFERCH